MRSNTESRNKANTLPTSPIRRPPKARLRFAGFQKRGYDESFKSRDLQGAFACWRLAKLFPNEGDQTVT